MFLMFTIHLIWAHATLEHLFPSISYWNNSVSFHLSMFFFPLQYVMNSHIMLIYLYLIWNTKYPTAETTVGLYWYNYCALNLQKKNPKLCLLSLFIFALGPWFQKAVGSSWRKWVTMGWHGGWRACLSIVFSLSDC